MMLTRCPGCSTTFRLTPEQVKARHGQVRCGRCQHVFDAIEHLLDAQLEVAPVIPPSSSLAASASPAPPPADLPLSTFEEVPDTAAQAAADLTQASTSPEAQPDSPEPPDSSESSLAAMQQETTMEAIEITQAPTADNNATVADDNQIGELSTEVATAPAAPDSDDILLQPSPLSSDYAANQAQQGPRWPWLIGVTCALIALIIQALLAFRVDLAAKYPAQRPLFEMLCAQFNCEVSLPSNPEQISIEGSDLHPAPKGGLELTATLRNRAIHAQSWPYLELTLTDGADKPIVRKVIEPLQYLPASQTLEEGFAANGELGIKLQLDAGTLPAAGYRLYLFYP